MSITPIDQQITNPPPPPTGIYDADFQNKVNDLLDWYNLHATEEIEFIAQLETMITELNSNSTDVSDVYDATVVVYNNAVAVYDATVVLRDETITLRDETQQIEYDVQAYVTNTLGTNFVVEGWDDVTDFADKTTWWNGSWWTSLANPNVDSEPSMANADWQILGMRIVEVVMASSTLTAECGNVVKVDATTIGSDCVITLPATPLNRCTIVIANLDLIRDNTLTIARGDVAHRIIGKLEDAEMNCLCEKTLVFEDITQNWIEG